MERHGFVDHSRSFCFNVEIAIATITIQRNPTGRLNRITFGYPILTQYFVKKQNVSWCKVEIELPLNSE